MATTRLIPMHKEKGKAFSQSISERIAYAMNDTKTMQGSLISAYECDTRTVIEEMLLCQRMHEVVVGKVGPGKNDVLLYQIRQSFKPGEITPEDALRIGHELALRFTKGQHQFIVATHVDHAHIHNHIVFNAITSNSQRRFRNYFGTSNTIRLLSDELCRKNGLSIIEEPYPNHEHYGKWLGNMKPIRWNERLRLCIDLALSQRPIDYCDFIGLLGQMGIIYRNGRNPSIRMEKQIRYSSLRALGVGYSEDDLIAVIRGERVHAPKAASISCRRAGENCLIKDIQRKMQEGRGGGLSRWGKVQSLKQIAKTFNYLMDNHLTNQNALVLRIRSIALQYDQLSCDLRRIEDELYMSKLAAMELNGDVIKKERISFLQQQRKVIKMERDAAKRVLREISIHHENYLYFQRDEKDNRLSLKLRNDEDTPSR